MENMSNKLWYYNEQQVIVQQRRFEVMLGECASSAGLRTFRSHRTTYSLPSMHASRSAVLSEDARYNSLCSLPVINVAYALSIADR